MATLAEHGAARLFLDRARDVQADFVVSEQNAHVIIQICRRLDGIPLAIELAAARARVLTPRQIAARLDDRFRLLTDSSRTADSRQRTLRSTIDWSYTLLSGAERVVLQRLSVFAGGCTLEAIEAICRDDADPIPDDVLDLVTRLADRSLVVVDLSGAEARYRLLETIRAYAVERLEASGEAERIRQRHAGYFLTLAELAGPQVRFADGRRWLDQLQFEHENLHAALARGAGAFDDRNLMPRMAGALWWYWHARGHLTEGRHWLGQALDVVVDPAVRLTVLYGAGTLAFHQDDYPQARECALESVALGRATGDQRAVAWALARLGIIARRAYCDEGLGLSRQLGDAETIAHTLIACGQVVRGLGDYEQADSYWEECLQLARVAGQTLFQSQTLVFRAAAAVVLGDLDRAETLCSEALALIRQREDRFQQIHPLEILVRVAKQRADVDRVAGLARDIGGGYSELGNRGGVALAASALAWVAHVCGDGPRAARLLGASDAVIAASGRVRTPGVIK